jgi:phage terminase small subunit
MSPEKAYAAAGYKPHRQNAHRLMTNGDVRRRVSELQDATADANRPDMARCMKELATIAFSDISRVVTWRGAVEDIVVRTDESGQEISETILRSNAELSLVASDQLDQHTRAAIQEVTQGRDGLIRVKMHPKLPALAQLADWLKAPKEQEDQHPASIPQSPAGGVIDFKAVLRRFQKRQLDNPVKQGVGR